MCAELHFNVCKETGVKLDNENWYDHVPKSLETSHEVEVTILWNQQVRTDRTVLNNQLDIIIRDNKMNMHVNMCCSYCRQKCDKDIG